MTPVNLISGRGFRFKKNRALSPPFFKILALYNIAFFLFLSGVFVGLNRQMTITAHQHCRRSSCKINSIIHNSCLLQHTSHIMATVLCVYLKVFQKCSIQMVRKELNDCILSPCLGDSNSQTNCYQHKHNL